MVSPARIARTAVRIPVVRETVQRLSRRDRGQRDLLAILTWHRVDEPSDALYPGLISATPDEFEEQAAWLASSFRVVTLADVVRRAAGGPSLPPRSVLLTFDDGYRDVATHAWPILRRHGLPAALFVPTAYPDHPERAFWWDRLHRALARPGLPAEIGMPDGRRLDLRTAADRGAASRTIRTLIKSLPHDRAMATLDAVVSELAGGAQEVDGLPAVPPVLGWDELRALAEDGLAIGSHTRTHPLLDRLPTELLGSELAGSRSDLRERLDVDAVTIAYPNGNHSPAVRGATVAAGYRIGFTTRRGLNDLRAPDWLALRRINVGRGSDPTILAAQLHRWFRFWP